MTKFPFKAVLEFSFLLFVFLFLHLASSFPFLMYKQLVRKELFPFVAWNNVNCSQSSMQWVQSCRTCSIEVYFEIFRSETRLWLQWRTRNDSETRLWRFSPRYNGMISFVYHFLEQIQRADWDASVFGSWVDLISNRRPRLPKTWSCNTSSATLKGHRKSRIQPRIQKGFHLIAFNNKWIHFSEKTFGR